MLLTKSIYVDTNGRIPFFLCMDNIPLCVCVCVYRYHIFFINSSINGQLGAVCLITQSCPCQSVFATPWTTAHQSPLSMGFSRQEYWRGLSCPPPGESSQIRDRTQLSRIASVFFINWTKRALRFLVNNAAMRLAHLCLHWEHSSVWHVFLNK